MTLSPGGHAQFGLLFGPLALMPAPWRCFHLLPHPFNDAKTQTGGAAALLGALPPADFEIFRGQSPWWEADLLHIYFPMKSLDKDLLTVGV